MANQKNTYRSYTNDKAVCLARVSSKKQQTTESPASQKEAMKSYCGTEGLNILRFFDITESAKDADNRKQYSEAIKWALKNKAHHIVFCFPNREGRNLTDIENNEKLIRNGDIVIHFAQSRKVIHRDSPSSDFLMRDVEAVLAKNFSRELSDRVNFGMLAKAERGWFPSNSVPLGYITWRPKDEYGRDTRYPAVVIKDPNEKNILQVNREFQLRAEGFSFDGIVEKIIEEGFIDPKNVRGYSKGVVENRLKNPFYRGKFRWDGKVYDGKHELIIPRPLLRSVDATLGKRGKLSKRGKGVFSGGWLRCAHTECGCQILYDPKTKPSGRTYNYYRCTNSRRVHKSMNGMTITEESIWQQFESVPDTISLTDEMAKDIAAALNSAHKNSRTSIHAEMEKYRAAIKSLDTREDQVSDLLIKNIFDETAYKKERRRIRDERDQYTHLLEKAQQSINDTFMETAQTILELAIDAKQLWKMQNEHERLDFLKRVCSNPVLNSTTIEYDLKKPYSILSKMRENQEWCTGKESNLRPHDS